MRTMVTQGKVIARANGNFFALDPCANGMISFTLSLPIIVDEASSLV